MDSVSERLFYIKDDEILQFLAADDSENEDNLLLDEEDCQFIGEDVECTNKEVIIEKLITTDIQKPELYNVTQNRQDSNVMSDNDLPNLPSTSRSCMQNVDYLKNINVNNIPMKKHSLTSKTKDNACKNSRCTEISIEKCRPNSKKKADQSLSWKNVYSKSELSLDIEENPPTLVQSFSKINIIYDEKNIDPLQVFNKCVGFDSLVDLIVEQSNLYMEQKGEPFITDRDEIKAFLGMNLVMGYHILPSIRDYWSTQPDLQVPYVSNIMPRTRFEKIRSALHFSDNSKTVPRSSPTYDKANKIRPVINHLNLQFQQSRENSEKQSIDEHMVKFKGHNTMKQYIKNKPVKWGFKLWCRCDSETGYLYQFDIYTGKKMNPERGLGEGIILQMTKNLGGKGIQFYFDNFFNSPLLQTEMLEKKLLACGTVRSERKEMPKCLKSEKEMKRGDIDFASTDNGVSCVKWMDNRSVLIMSNYISPLDKVTVERRLKGSNDKVKINCPKMINEYNKYMGGVDLMDQKKVTYEVDRRSKIKYYLRLFFDLLDISVNNACIVYNQLLKNENTKPATSLEYRQMIARGLIGNYTNRMRSLCNTPLSRKSNIRPSSKPEHSMEKTNIRRRCVQCAKKKVENRTNCICVICQVYLCFTNERNCFEQFH